MTCWLTRAVLDRNAPEHALRPLLDPGDTSAAFNAHHALIWTLFPGKDAKRDFLWRADNNGKFLILSARKPHSSCLFRLETKPFAPVLVAGDRLTFLLRANATKDRRSVSGEDTVPGSRCRPRKDRRVDVVIHAMQEQELKGGAADGGSRAARRMDIADEAARCWLAGQGERRGFSVDELAVEDYRVAKLKRRRGKDAAFGVLDLRGLLTVRAPAVFIDALNTGFGRAKAYGCGLMLVRRA